MDLTVKCWYCDGSGYIRTCPVCYGKGSFKRKNGPPRTCGHCHGLGEIPLPKPLHLVERQSRRCPKCQQVNRSGAA